MQTIVAYTDRVRNARVPRSRLLVAVVFASLSALEACGSLTDPDPDYWIAEVVGTAGYPDVDGGADAESTSGTLEIQIGLGDLDVGGQYAWWVEGGTCAVPSGIIVGNPDDYPVIQGDLEGNGTGEANLSRGLDPNANYHISVRLAADPDTAVACGELLPAPEPDEEA